MKNRLYRSRQNKMFAGVAGGLGEYFGLDPIIFRALFIITAIGLGSGFLIYILLWILIPEESLDYKYTYDKESKKYVYNDISNEKEVFRNSDIKKHRTVLFGIILIALGIIVIISKILPDLSFQTIIPIALVLIGILIIIKPKIFSHGGINEIK